MKRMTTTTSEVFFLCAYAIYVVSYILESSLYEIGPVMRYIRFAEIIILILFFLRMYMTTRRRLIFACIIAFVFLISAYFAHQTEVMVTMSFLICAKAAKFRRIVLTSFLCTLCTTAFVIVSSICEIIPDYTYWREALSTTAHSYGFGYYSAIPFIFLFLMMGYMYLREKNMTWIEVLIFFGLSYYVFRAFTTRLIFVLSILCLVLYILVVKLEWIRLRTKLAGAISAVGFTLFGIISIVLAYIYDPSNKWLYAIDSKIMNTRLKNGAEAFQRYDVSPVGQVIEMVGNTDVMYGGVKESAYFYIDCGFLYSFLCYGVIFTVIVVILYTALMRRSRFYENRMLFVWVTVVMFFTVINNTWLTVAYNPVLFALPVLIEPEVKEALLRYRKKQRVYRTFYW